MAKRASRNWVLPTLAAISLAGCQPQAADPRGVEADEVLLRVSATGDAETRPDLARFSAGVSSIGATSEAATTANNAKMTKVMAAIEGAGVKRDDTQTQSLTVNRIDWGPNRRKFEASNIVSVKVRRIDDAGKVLAAATDAGANILSGPDLQIDDKEAASKSAYAAAYKAARARADAYAEAAGLEVVRILTISDGNAGEPRAPYEMDAVAEQATSVGPPIRAGLTTRTAQVRVDFALAPK